MKAPQFARLGNPVKGTAVEKRGEKYYRANGAWEIDYVIKDDKILASAAPGSMAAHLNGMEFFERSKADHENDNL